MLHERGPWYGGRPQAGGLEPVAMVHVVNKRTRKRQVPSIGRGAVKRSRQKKGADFSDLVGTAPLHKDPVKFQRALRAGHR